ncbi:MAG: SDR family oxidoreductase [Granulosicoccaceae bacterium]
MQTVFVAGATGYLGKYLISEFHRRGWRVIALVRDKKKASQLNLAADVLLQAQATHPETLQNQLQGVDLVVSSLGITRQRDGLDYRDVDYQANINILHEALRAKVPQFAYVHVLNAADMLDVPLVAAKQAFVNELQAAPICSTVIAPSGFFSDMTDFIAMARTGRIWLFGQGNLKLNPIHGADLAQALADATEGEQSWLNIGGPETFSHRELAQLAFEALEKPAKITAVPDAVRRLVLRTLPHIGFSKLTGPLRFFFTAMGMNMVGEPHGKHTLAEHFRQEITEQRRN